MKARLALMAFDPQRNLPVELSMGINRGQTIQSTEPSVLGYGQWKGVHKVHVEERSDIPPQKEKQVPLPDRFHFHIENEETFKDIIFYVTNRFEHITNSIDIHTPSDRLAARKRVDSILETDIKPKLIELLEEGDEGENKGEKEFIETICQLSEYARVTDQLNTRNLPPEEAEPSLRKMATWQQNLSGFIFENSYNQPERVEPLEELMEQVWNLHGKIATPRAKEIARKGVITQTATLFRLAELGVKIDYVDPNEDVHQKIDVLATMAIEREEYRLAIQVKSVWHGSEAKAAVNIQPAREAVWGNDEERSIFFRAAWMRKLVPLAAIVTRDEGKSMSKYTGLPTKPRPATPAEKALFTQMVRQTADQEKEYHQKVTTHPRRYSF